MFFILRGSSPTGPNGWTGQNSGDPTAILSNQNRDYAHTSGSGSTCAFRRYGAAQTGKRYLEWQALTDEGGNTQCFLIGLVDRDDWVAVSSWYTKGQFDTGIYGIRNRTQSGVGPSKNINGTPTAHAMWTWVPPTRVSMFVDFDALAMWFAFDGAVVTGDPEAGTGAPITLPDANFDPICIHRHQFASSAYDLSRVHFRSDQWVHDPGSYIAWPEA